MGLAKERRAARREAREAIKAEVQGLTPGEVRAKVADLVKLREGRRMSHAIVKMRFRD